MDEIDRNIINDELTEAQKKEIKKEAKEIINENKVIDKIYQKNLSKEDKISNFFNAIEFLSMDDEQKGEVALKLKEDSSGGKLYWMLIMLSSIIAALGLLQNSSAVVIGAMLIAPLLKPINGLSFSIARGGQKFFYDALRVLLLSIIISILMGYLTTKLVGLNIETTEILARSRPNIIDFFIASFSAIVAVLSLRFEKLGESIAGVAMAASLMPPLAVVGIELSIGNYGASFGALMLFGANLFAILFVATIFFWFYGFTPHIEKLQKSTFKRLYIMMIGMIIIIIPLISSFLSIKNELEIKQTVGEYLLDNIGNNLEYFEISELEVNTKNNDLIILDSTIKIYEQEDILDAIKNINGELSSIIGKNIEINFEIIRILNIKSN